MSPALTPAPPHGSPTRPSDLDVFEDWLATHNALGRDPISDPSARQYRQRWQHWCRWLQERSSGNVDPRAGHALLATPELVRQFLEHGRSEASIANRRVATEPFSPTTQKRYWDTLERVYQHAVNQGQLQHNPVPQDHGPAPERRDAAVVSARVLAAIPQVLPSGSQWSDVRDRALIMIALDAALTPAELCGLQLSQVETALEDPHRIRLNLQGKRAAQTRQLLLQRAASDELTTWLYVREGLASAGDIALEAHDHVFVSQRESKRIYTPVHFYPLVHRVLQAATALAEHRAAPEPRQRDGAASRAQPQYSPMVIRNSKLLLRLVHERDYAQLLYDAGFKDHLALRGLIARLPPEAKKMVMQRLRPTMKGSM